MSDPIERSVAGIVARHQREERADSGRLHCVKHPTRYAISAFPDDTNAMCAECFQNFHRGAADRRTNA